MILTNKIQIGYHMVPVITHPFVQNYMEHCLEIILEMKELTDIILCVLLMNMINNIHRRMLPAEPEAIINKYMGVV